MSQFENDTCDPTTRDDIFKKVVGEDKNDYAKTFGMASKSLLPVLKDALWRKSGLKESKLSRSARKLKRKFISWRR